MAQLERAEGSFLDGAALASEITALLREGGWDGDDVVAGVRGLITHSETLRSRVEAAEAERLRVVWALVAAAGGTIRVPERLIVQAGPGCQVTRWEDQGKGEVVFRAGF